MQRLPAQPRANWQKTVEEQGLVFHTPDENTYWNESAYYQFTRQEIDELEKATYALNDMCLAAVEHVISNHLLDRFHIPPEFHDWIGQSWEHDEITIVGRFDLAFDGNQPPKLLEYNADTPTSLLEASVIQWQWMKDARFGNDQFNSIHERLIEAWGKLPKNQTVHFTGITENIEDFVTVSYLQDTATQAGLTAAYLDIETMGWDHDRRLFVDDKDQPISRCFKLYPWEWMLRELYAPHLPNAPISWLEPPWKMVLSNKQILVVLSELYPNSPYLLKSANQPMGDSFVKKPILAREGANVTVVQGGQVQTQSEGAYAAQPSVYQELFQLPNFNGNHAILGSWMVNGYACGLGIREDNSKVTGNYSRFVPHVFE
jgi:glutathionylspermidine synthase